MITFRALKLVSASVGASGIAALVVVAAQTSPVASGIGSVEESGHNPTAYSTASYAAPRVPLMQGLTTTTTVPIRP